MQSNNFFAYYEHLLSDFSQFMIHFADLRTKQNTSDRISQYNRMHAPKHSDTKTVSSECAELFIRMERSLHSNIIS